MYEGKEFQEGTQWNTGPQQTCGSNASSSCGSNASSSCASELSKGTHPKCFHEKDYYDGKEFHEGTPRNTGTQQTCGSNASSSCASDLSEGAHPKCFHEKDY